MFKRLAIKLWAWKEELWSIPAALLLFIYAPEIIRWVDPTAGAYDAGVLHILIYAVVALLSFHAVAWIGLKRVFPELFDFFQDEFKNAFKNLTEWQKVKVALLVFFAFLFALVLLARTI